MWYQRIIFVLGLFLFGTFHCTTALWTCTSDLDCLSLSGSQCSAGDCLCATGQQAVLGGTLCADLSPYHTSQCVEDHQCSRLVTAFQCSGADGTAASCLCQPNHHYFLGRCWPTADHGQPCTRSEQCLSILRDPYSLVCDGVCTCADGYYERQRGECRKIGFGVGDGCVLDEDCQFERGACDVDTFQCYDIGAEIRLEPENHTKTDITSNTTKTFGKSNMAVRQHGVGCTFTDPCAEPFECSMYGSCVCPVGYYVSEDGVRCLAELGSPATSDDCIGLFATVIDGVCTCPNNFYFDDNMRDCVKATRRITESCVTDSNCHTFGAAARCGEPQLPWGIRSCECQPELAVWDSNRQMCRLFAGIGEACDTDSDCLAGELEIQCVVSAGQGVCACPDGYIADGGLCLTSGLDLGDSCQVSIECTATDNSVCQDGVCACDSTGYQEVDGGCAPIIGGVCTADSDCVISNTVCRSPSDGVGTTCQCDTGFVQFQDICWTVVSGYEAPCNVSAQCAQSMGPSDCLEGICQCDTGHHYRDDWCWRQTDLYESCSRTSECYLGALSERVVCRNGLCQCDFDYPFSETEGTCRSSAASKVASIVLIIGLLCVSYTINRVNYLEFAGLTLLNPLRA